MVTQWTPKKRLIRTIKANNQVVDVMQVENLTGFSFDAVGKESLPLAVELAVRQAKEMREAKEDHS